MDRRHLANFLVVVWIALLTSVLGLAQERNPLTVEPLVADLYGGFIESFEDYEVILQPDEQDPGWWAGGPSVVRDKDGVFWMACRMRTTQAPRGLRGYEIRILRSDDGIQFEKVHSIPRGKVPIPGFERPALLIDPKSGKFKLYGCGPWDEGPWAIIKWEDAALPTEFVPSTARPVIEPVPRSSNRDTAVSEYKDPFIIHAEGSYHCYVIGYVRRSERLYHFQSEDGEKWEPVGHRFEPVMSLDGWHDFFIRPASVLPLGVGYLFFYEGSSLKWHDPVYNVATGLGFTFDLHRITDLTPESPIAISTTPNRQGATWRYSHWMWVDDEIWAYAEVAAENGTHEVRLFRFQR